MATRENTGTYRIRRRTPGYGRGYINIRIATRDKRTAEKWEGLLLDAYHEGQFDILDALIERTISFPEALRLRASGGWVAVRDAILAKHSERTARQYNAEALLREFIATNPRNVRPKTLRTIATHVGCFIDWIKHKHRVIEVDVRRTFTRDNVREFRDYLINTRYRDRISKLESEWNMKNAPVSETERQHIRERILGAIRATANRYVNSVGAVSSWLVSRGLLANSPAVGVRLSTRAENPYREQTYRYFTPAMLRVFLEYSRRYDQLHPTSPGVPKPDTLFWRFLLATGATTRNEGARFCIRHLAMDRVQSGMVPVYIHGTKTSHRPREVYIPIGLAKELVERANQLNIGDDSPLFPFSHYDYMKVWRGVMRMIKEERPPEWRRIITHVPYDLRHTYAVNVLRAGADLEQLRRLMGHSSITTTQMYAKHQQSPVKALKRMSLRLNLG